MRLDITKDLLENNDTLQSKAIAKVFNRIEWDADDFSHGEYQWMLTNDVEIHGGRLYSPELTESQALESVPANWPNSAIVDTEYAEQEYEPQEYDPITGDPLPLVPLPLEIISETERQKTWLEYCVYLKTTNGYCLQYGGSAKVGGNTTSATTAELKQWETKFSGFLTRAEAYALRDPQEGA